MEGEHPLLRIMKIINSLLSVVLTLFLWSCQTPQMGMEIKFGTTSQSGEQQVVAGTTSDAANEASNAVPDTNVEETVTQDQIDDTVSDTGVEEVENQEQVNDTVSDTEEVTEQDQPVDNDTVPDTEEVTEQDQASGTESRDKINKPLPNKTIPKFKKNVPDKNIHKFKKPDRTTIAPKNIYEVRFVNFGPSYAGKIAATINNLSKTKRLVRMPGGSTSKTSVIYKIQWLNRSDSPRHIMQMIQEAGKNNGLVMGGTNPSPGVLVFQGIISKIKPIKKLRQR
jgi:hypothetical protein